MLHTQHQEHELEKIVEAAPQEPASTMELMEEEVLQQGANIERATSTMTEAISQEPTLTMKLVEQINSTVISKDGPH